MGDEETDVTVESDIALLDFDAPAEVTDKLDGSLLILYRHPDGKPAVCTKGSFDSDQAVFFTKLLRRDTKYIEAAERFLSELPEMTCLFEGVGPSNHIILAYPKDEIVLLGLVHNFTGEYLSSKTARSIWRDDCHTCCEEMSAQNLGDAIKMADRQGKEGVVVRILSADPERQMMIKVKQEDYLTLHRLVTGFGEGAIREALVSAKVSFADLDRVASTGSSLELPEIRRIVEFDNSPIFQSARDHRRRQFDEAVVPAALSAAKGKAYVARLPSSMFQGDPREAKKRFALSIEEAAEETGVSHAVLFILAAARIAGVDLDSVDASTVMKAAAKKVRRVSKLTLNAY